MGLYNTLIPDESEQCHQAFNTPTAARIICSNGAFTMPPLLLTEGCWLIWAARFWVGIPLSHKSWMNKRLYPVSQIGCRWNHITLYRRQSGSPHHTQLEPAVCFTRLLALQVITLVKIIYASQINCILTELNDFCWSECILCWCLYYVSVVDCSNYTW